MFLYSLSSALLFIFFSLLAYSIKNGVLEWRRIILLAIATIAFKAPVLIEPFFGLEYEDSYIFSVVARQFAENNFTNSFFTESIVLGSMEDPILYGTYSGHHILFSVFSSWIIRIFGYSADLLSYINVGITFLILLLLSSFSKILKLGENLWWVIPCVFIFSPIINVFGSTQLSETFSSFLIISFLYFLLILRQKPGIITGITMILSFVLSILVKRENNILVFVILFFLLYDIIIEKKYRNVQSWIWYLVLLIVHTVIFFSFQELNRSIEVESGEIGTAAFSLEYFSSIFPVFIKSILSFRFFAITGVLLAISMAFIFISKRSIVVTLFIFIILGYLALYSIHYRSYYFIHYQSINEFETFRYLNNIYPIIATVIGYFICNLYQQSKAWKWITIISMTILSTLSFYYTVTLRKNFSQEEENIRFKHPRTIVDYLSDSEDGYIIFSTDALIFQIIGPRDLLIGDVLDIESAMQHIPDDLEVYLHTNSFMNSELFNKRYTEVSNWIESRKFDCILTLDEDSELLRLKCRHEE